MSRTTLLFLIAGLPCLAIVWYLYFAARLKQFLRDTPAIASTRDLDAFKVVVKGQMVAALVQLVLLNVPWILLIYGYVRTVLHGADALYLLVPNLVVFVLGKQGKKIEGQAQNLKVADEQLQKERDRVVHIWLHKPFPNW